MDFFRPEMDLSISSLPLLLWGLALPNLLASRLSDVWNPE